MRSIFKKAIVYLNVVFIGALLLSYISIHINPKSFWMPSFFGLAYPFILSVNVFFVVYWIYKKKKEFLYSLIVILIGWNYLANFFQIPSKSHPPKDGETMFKVLSYNVRLFNRYDWANNANANREIIDLINNQNPDIICLQEYYARKDGNFTSHHIKELIKNASYTHVANSIDERNYQYGIATYSKYPIINRGVIEFPNTVNISIYDDIVINSDTIRVFNNHLQSIRFDKKNYEFITNSKEYKDEARLNEIKDISYRLRDAFMKRAEQVEVLSYHIKSSPYPVVICGDFNDTPVSFAYHKIRSDLKDAFLESGRWLGHTYDGKFPSYRIDYILHTDSLESHDFKIIRKKLSDHFPITTTIGIEH